MVDKSQSIAAIIFSKDRKKVLLIKRRDVPVWVLPGGGIERNETKEEAIIREVNEETGFDVTISRLIGEYTPINKLAKYTYIYECAICEGTPTTGDETKAIRFFPVDQLPKLIPPPYPDWIKDAHQNNTTVYKKISSVTYPTLIKNLLLHPSLVIRFLLSRMGFHINT